MNEIIIHPSDQSGALSTFVDVPLEKHPAAVYISSLASPHSRTNMRRYLDQIAGMLTNGARDALTLNWGELRSEHTEAIKARLAEKYAPATANVMLSALRGVLKKAWRLKYMSAEDYQRAIDIENVKGTRLPAGRDLASGEVSALAAKCFDDPTPAGYRDAAIIGILATCGLRRAELAALRLADVDASAGKITITQGKGNKARTVYVPEGTVDALMKWLDKRGADGEFLFTPILKSNKKRKKTPKIITDKGLSAQAIYRILDKRGKEAGVKDFSPHDFRRTFAGDAMDAGIDIITLSKIMGHANIETTGRYDRRPEEAKKIAAKRLHFPMRAS